MKKRFLSFAEAALKTLAGGFILLAFVVLALPHAAHATLAANTKIINSAQLSYNDGVETRTATASVTVTINLVEAAPTITPGPAKSTAYTDTATTTDTFTITAGSNGPVTYNITSAVTDSTNTSGVTLTPSPTSVTLGATTVLSGSSGSNTITVPSDGTSNNVVNGIEAGDTVVIDGNVYTVASVSDNASGTSTITLTTPLTTSPSVGSLIAEQKTISVTVDPSDIITPGTSVTVTDNITATSTTASPITTTSGTVLNTFTSGKATLAKFVRNVTTGAVGDGATTSYGGNTYYATNVTAKSGDTLEYILVATNEGSGAVTASVITDALPTTYVTFKAAQYTGSKDIKYVDENGTASYLSAASDTDTGSYSSPTLTVNVGTGATNSAGGSIGAAKTVSVLYQVTVNN